MTTNAYCNRSTNAIIGTHTYTYTHIHHKTVIRRKAKANAPITIFNRDNVKAGRKQNGKYFIQILFIYTRTHILILTFYTKKKKKTMQNYIFSMDLEYGKYMNNLLSVATHFDLLEKSFTRTTVQNPPNCPRSNLP